MAKSKCEFDYQQIREGDCVYILRLFDLRLLISD